VRGVQQSRDLSPKIARLLASTADFRGLAQHHLGRLSSGGGTEQLLETINEMRLTALLGSRAIALAPGSLGDSFANAVAETLATSRARSLALEAFGIRVVEYLEAAGIPALPLKGPFLAKRLYGDGGMRLVNDIDILVALEHTRKAAALIAEMGYVGDDPPWIEGIPDLHYVMRDPNRHLPRIELHWRIHWYEQEFSRALLERSAPGSDGLREARVEDELAALLLYYARDGFYGLRMAADIAGWWDAFCGTKTSSPVLERHWVDYPRLRRPFCAAALAAQQVVGVPAASLLPDSAFAEFRTRLAVRLTNWSQRGELDQLAANVDLIDGLLTPTDDLWRFLRRHAFLNRTEIASVYDLGPADRARTAIWQIVHGPKVGVRYLLGILGALLPRRARRPLRAS
jgi:hypothetical protein